MRDGRRILVTGMARGIGLAVARAAMDRGARVVLADIDAAALAAVGLPHVAMDEAFWTGMFDKHHPEHSAQGLAPHGCVERWYCGRSVAALADPAGAISARLRAGAAAKGHPSGLAAAEYLRLHRRGLAGTGR